MNRKEIGEATGKTVTSSGNWKGNRLDSAFSISRLKLCGEESSKQNAHSRSLPRGGKRPILRSDVAAGGCQRTPFEDQAKRSSIERVNQEIELPVRVRLHDRSSSDIRRPGLVQLGGWPSWSHVRSSSSIRQAGLVQLGGWPS
ncbi:hypothetical protein F2Q70_00029584 [Brassica cretica]|uniref:Uncharacterized protein n=1 Tax=Brassica cretica TaxID=69181 RepID=A0A8S9FNB5_BRACR|nr:hypothetical protein F2Q70_00029584 [Brassica cretica]